MPETRQYSQFTIRINGPLSEAQRLQERVTDAIETATMTDTKKLAVEVEVLLVQPKRKK